MEKLAPCKLLSYIIGPGSESYCSLTVATMCSRSLPFTFLSLLLLAVAHTCTPLTGPDIWHARYSATLHDSVRKLMTSVNSSHMQLSFTGALICLPGLFVHNLQNCRRQQDQRLNLVVLTGHQMTLNSLDS